MLMRHPQEKVILNHADVLCDHGLKQALILPKYDTWGVILQTRDTAIYVGENSQDLDSSCWPFLAAHEAAHMISSACCTDNDALFLFYNICEDRRINDCLLSCLPSLRPSYNNVARVFHERWKTRPLRLKSPLARQLQNLCFLNHLPEPKEIHKNIPVLYEVYRVFCQQKYWPVLQPSNNRARLNESINQGLLNMLRNTPMPEGEPKELQMLIEQLGYRINNMQMLQAIQ